MLWLHHPIYGVAPPLSCVSSTYQITNFLDNHSLTCPFLLVGKMIENIKFKTTGPHPSDNWSTHHLSTAPQVLPWTSIRNPWHPFLARFGQSVGCWGVNFLSSWTTTSLANGQGLALIFSREDILLTSILTWVSHRFCGWKTKKNKRLPCGSSWLSHIFIHIIYPLDSHYPM